MFVGLTDVKEQLGRIRLVLVPQLCIQSQMVRLS